MAVKTTCSACGITIRFDNPDVEFVARGDRFWHPSCVEVHTEKVGSSLQFVHILYTSSIETRV